MRPRAWDEGLGTGIGPIDAEHRVQVSLVNALEEGLRGGGEVAGAAATLQQLADLSAVHFAAEEHLMRRLAYPHLAAHAQEHARLLSEVVNIRARIEGGDRAAALVQVGALRGWLTSHVKAMDQAFALWCARNGLRPDAPAR